jgi:hypothetical protein
VSARTQVRSVRLAGAGMRERLPAYVLSCFRCTTLAGVSPAELAYFRGRSHGRGGPAPSQRPCQVTVGAQRCRVAALHVAAGMGSAAVSEEARESPVAPPGRPWQNQGRLSIRLSVVVESFPEKFLQAFPRKIL